jgi:hypothetical protein
MDIRDHHRLIKHLIVIPLICAKKRSGNRSEHTNKDVEHLWIRDLGQLIQGHKVDIVGAIDSCWYTKDLVSDYAQTHITRVSVLINNWVERERGSVKEEGGE